MSVSGIESTKVSFGPVVGLISIMFLLFIAARGSLLKYKAILTQKNLK